MGLERVGDRRCPVGVRAHITVQTGEEFLRTTTKIVKRRRVGGSKVFSIRVSDGSKNPPAGTGAIPDSQYSTSKSECSFPYSKSTVVIVTKSKSKLGIGSESHSSSEGRISSLIRMSNQFPDLVCARSN